jgi:hypothetical protein
LEIVCERCSRVYAENIEEELAYIFSDEELSCEDCDGELIWICSPKRVA